MLRNFPPVQLLYDLGKPGSVKRIAFGHHRDIILQRQLHGMAHCVKRDHQDITPLEIYPDVSSGPFDGIDGAVCHIVIFAVDHLDPFPVQLQHVRHHFLRLGGGKLRRLPLQKIPAPVPSQGFIQRPRPPDLG